MGIVCLDQGKIMQAYLRKLKLRLAWWITWWSLCILGGVIQAIAVIDIIRFPYFASDLDKLVQPFWLLVFGSAVFLKVPGKEKLLVKDSNKNIIYAKAMLLEIKLKRHKKEKKMSDEHDDLAGKVESMQKELDEMMAANPIQHPNKN